MRNDVCILVLRTVNGSQVKETPKEIYCEKSSCTRSEHYQAYAVGLSPKINLDIDPLDFESMSVVVDEECITPQKVIYKGAKYNILRTYEKGESTLSLTLG